ncbi:MAG: hypothetical protein QW101_08285, partial [Ignisphaera sp.]
GKETVRKDREENNKNAKEEITNLKEELKADISDILKEAQELYKQYRELGISSIPFIPNITWEQIINIVAANPSQHVLTKEDFERLNSAFNAKLYVLDYNLHEYLAQLSTDRCMLERLIIFIVIKKVAPQLLQFKLNRMNAIIQTIQAQGTLYQAITQLLQTALTTIPNPVFELGRNLKWDAIVTSALVALGAISLEIGNLKNNLRNLIRDNEFCIKACSPTCGDTIPLRLSNTEEDNEGKRLVEMIEKVNAKLERLMDIELKLIEENPKLLLGDGNIQSQASK